MPQIEAHTVARMEGSGASCMVFSISANTPSIDAGSFPSSANRINAEVYRSIYSEYPMKTEVFHHPLDQGRRQNQGQNETQAAAQRKSLFVTVLFTAALGETVKQRDIT